jgi:RNA-binding protein YhbY
MYLHTTVQVRGHVFVYYGSSERLFICILRFKWAVMYLYTTVQVSGNVFVYYGSSEQYCICILRFKWAVMYLYTTIQVRGHVFVCYVVSPLSFPPISLLDFATISTVWYICFCFCFIKYYIHPICTVIWYIFLIKCSYLY